MFESEGIERLRYLTIALVVLAAGCTVTKTPAIVDGSRSDAVITMAYEKPGLAKVVVDRDGALERAKEACAVWGYISARPFGGSISECMARNEFGCIRHRVYSKYQCTHAIDDVKSAADQAPPQERSTPPKPVGT